MQATPPPEPPPAIIVTARALPDPAVERAYSIAVIGRERLQNAPTTQLDQLLKEVPGLQLFRRSDARTSHPTSQGVTLRGLGGNASSRALLTLDGVPQTDPFGGWVNWPAYDPASLSEVRVIRGGGSVANGPGALAGTIEMRSRREQDITASAEASGRDSIEGRLAGGVAVAGGTLGFSARGARGDGFIPVSEGTRGPADIAAPYEEASVRAFWAAPVGTSTFVELSGLAFTDRRERGVAFTANRTDGADAAIRLVGHGRLQWIALAYGQTRELESSFASVSDGRVTASRVSLQDSVPSNSIGASFEVRPLVGSNVQLRLGGDLRRNEGETRELYSYADGHPTRRRRAGGNLRTAGIFAEATTSVDRMTLSAGGRFDHWRIDDGGLFEQTIATGAVLTDVKYPSRSGWLPTARASAVLDLSDGWTLTSAAYLGWRPPTLNELFRPFRAGSDATAANPLLDPERLAGAEVGARYRSGPVSLSATAFANRLKDTIANVTLGQGPGSFPGVGFVTGEYRQRQNLDAVSVRGIELSGELRHRALTVSAAASWASAEVDSDGAATPLDGLRPAQTPRLGLTGGIAWEGDGRALSLLVRHVGAQFEDDLNVDRLPPATTVDAFAAWPVSRKLQLFARAENLTNELVVAGIGGDRSIERGTPRTFSVGIRFQSTRGTP
ncbi:MAG TPA: TonB-dependent receptor [Sphingomicrobium sp.]|nr:TonB-dependent receptor [Sphingomicrobium sp.]